MLSLLQTTRFKTHETDLQFGAAQRLFGCFITSLQGFTVARFSIIAITINAENESPAQQRRGGICLAEGF